MRSIHSDVSAQPLPVAIDGGASLAHIAHHPDSEGLRSRVREDANVLMDVRFPDFESDRSVVSVIQDYSNAFLPLRFLNLEYDRAFVLRVIREVTEFGIPPVADYFCIKAISGGVTMDKRAMGIWKNMEKPLREEFRNLLFKRHFSALSEGQWKLVELVEQGVDRTNVALRILFVTVSSVGETAFEMDDVRLAMEDIRAMADDLASLMGLFNHPERADRHLAEIE